MLTSALEQLQRFVQSKRLLQWLFYYVPASLQHCPRSQRLGRRFQIFGLFIGLTVEAPKTGIEFAADRGSIVTSVAMGAVAALLAAVGYGLMSFALRLVFTYLCACRVSAKTDRAAGHQDCSCPPKLFSCLR